MDFNAIVNKLREIEPTDIANPNAEAPKADTKAPVVLSEAAQLRVKAGISTVLAESAKIEEAKGYCSDKCCGSDVKSEDCSCDPSCSHCDCNNVKESVEEAVDDATLIAQELKKMGVSSNASEDEIYGMIPKALKSLNLGSVLRQMNISKGYRQDMVNDVIVAFSGMKESVEEGKMPQAALDALAKKKGKKAKKTGDDQKDESTETKTKSKKFDEEVEDILRTAEAKLVKEAKKKMPMDDNGTPNDKSDDKPAFLKGKKDTSKKGADSKDNKPAKGLSAKQKKLPAGLQKAIAKKKGAKTESTKTTKKAVAESMSFLDAIKIVKESNGEMKVNAVDTAIWNWAKRVAASTVTEGGIKQEAYAAKVYESRGGEWDVTKNIISE